MIPTDPIWIATDEELAVLCERWRGQAAIAVDTEFMRSSTFYPIAGLIQIGDGKGCYLIDPLAINDLSPLKALMLDEAVIKVLHSCSEDLEVFQVLLACVPSPIFDTQIAAAFAGHGFSLGYAALVKLVLGIEVPKDETRSDWLQRPLSVAQLKYAALDVAHMLIVYGKLLITLKEQGRLQWVKDDCAELVVNARAEGDLTEAYKKIGLAWKLRPNELAVLRELCIWREIEARARDIPRNRLIKEPSLWEMARKQPKDVAALARINDLPHRTLQQDADALLEIINIAVKLPAEQHPQRLNSPLAPTEAPRMKLLKRVVREIAENLSLPPELLVRKKEYEHIVRSVQKNSTLTLPERLNGWRYEVVGKALYDAATSSINEFDEKDHETYH